MLLSQSSQNVANNDFIISYMNSIDRMRPIGLGELHVIDSSHYSQRKVFMLTLLAMHTTDIFTLKM